MYPVEFIMILLVVMMLQAMGAALGKMLERARVFPGDASPVRGLLPRYGPWLTAAMTLSVGLHGTWMIVGRDAGTYHNFGRALATRGKLGDSLSFLQEAVQRDPANLQIMNDLALAHLQLGQYREAIPLLREALHAKPRDADNHYHLGLALAQSGMVQEGLKHLQEALRLDPSHQNARKAVSTLANQQTKAP